MSRWVVWVINIHKLVAASLDAVAKVQPAVFRQGLGAGRSSAVAGGSPSTGLFLGARTKSSNHFQFLIMGKSL
jgi:hypothetical protein